MDLHKLVHVTLIVTSLFPCNLLLLPLTSPPSHLSSLSPLLPLTSPSQEEPEEFIAAQWYKAATNASNPVEQLKAYQKAIQSLQVEDVYCVLC